MNDDTERKIRRRLIQEAALAYWSTPVVIPSTVTTEEFLRSSQELAERAKARNLPVSECSFRREDIYEDDEGQ